MSERFKILYTGEIREGYNQESVKTNLMKIFRLGEEMAERIINTPGMVLKQAVEEEDHNTYLTALKKAGVEVESSPASEDGEKASFDEETELDLQPGDDTFGSMIDEMESELPVEDLDDITALPEDTPAAKVEISTMPGQPFSFTGKGSAYFKIWLLNIVLSVVTLGIFTAWAKVRRRRYLYGHTFLDGSSFEYLADPRKILVFRLWIVCMIAIFAVAQWFYPLYSLGLIPVLILLIPWLINHRMAFHLQQTSYRQTPFGFKGSYIGSVRAFLLWPLIGIASAGILIPFALYKQHVYLVTNSRYGDQSFECSATPGDYYEFLTKILLLLLLFAGIEYGIYSYAISLPIYQSYAAMAIPAVVLFFYFWSYMMVRHSALWLGLLVISDQKVLVRFGVNRYWRILLFNSLLFIVTLGLYYPWALTRKLRFKCSHLSLISTSTEEN